jgi:hypothetical protein
MLDRAKREGFAYPAINVTSSQTLNAALRGFAEAESDGIIQVSTGGAEFLSGATVKDMVAGASALAEYARVVAKNYPVQIALHTDHCPKNKLDGYMKPLIKISQERVARGEEPLFQPHMWDGSAMPLEENLDIAAELIEECAKARVHHGDGDRRGRRRGGLRRRRDQREAVHDARRRAQDGGGRRGSARRYSAAARRARRGIAVPAASRNRPPPR